MKYVFYIALFMICACGVGGLLGLLDGLAERRKEEEEEFPWPDVPGDPGDGYEKDPYWQ